MSRNRSSHPQDDQVVPAHQPDDKRYRLLGVEPHGWSTFLVEDRDGAYYFGSASTGTLVPATKESVEHLLQTRVYRRWNGERAWSVLAELPLVASTFLKATLAVNRAESQQAAF